jgi:hypothetical protein
MIVPLKIHDCTGPSFMGTPRDVLDVLLMLDEQELPPKTP